MIQFNLLPDVKMDYIKAKNLKRSVIVISGIVAAVSLALFLLMFATVNGFQKKRISDLNGAIAKDSKTLRETPDITKVLTVQNQLNSLSSLHDQKPVTSRLFGYISQLVPAQASIGKLELDFVENKMTITGTLDTTTGGDAANALGNTNKFIDTLKFAEYTYPSDQGAEQKAQAFSNVVLSKFTRTEKEATYEITLNFSKDIFDNNKKVTLVVPKITSTRSDVEKPSDIFKSLPKTEEEKQ